MAQPKLLLVDGHALIHRAFHALPDLRTRSTGEPTGAVFGFATMLLRALREQQPTHVAVAFDHPAPTFRHQQFAAYKAQRPASSPDLHSQVPRVKQLVEALELAAFELEGYEADDIIGTLVEQGVEQGFRIVIVTGDLDTLQLVGPNVSVVTPKQSFSDILVYDEETIRVRYGLKPSQLADFKALRGDPSDNIPGAPGIGEKTAARLLQEFGSIEALYERLEEVTPPKLRETLRAYEEQVRLSKRLATIERHLPITLDPARCALRSFDKQRALQLFHELEFASLVPRLNELSQELAKRAPEESPAASATVSVTRETDYRLIQDAAAWQALCTELAQAKRLAVDTETTGQNALRSALVGVSLSWAPGRAAYLPLGHEELDHQLPPAVLQELKALLEDPKVEKVAHNAKFDIEVLAEAGIHLEPVTFDTMLAAQLLGEKAANLKSLVFNRLGIEMTPIKQLIGTRRQGQLTMAQVAVDEAAAYACADADMTGRLVPVLEHDLREQGMWDLFREVEMPLIPVLVAMEQTGVAIDTELLRAMSTELRRELARVEEEIYAAVGHRFVIGSPQQLGRVLFEELRLPHSRRTKTGYSTEAAVLEELRGAHPVIDLVLQHRQLSKLLSTYVDALPALLHPKTGRLHTIYNQIGAATGRLSSSEPNLQNIPIRGETGAQIRQAFVGRGDHGEPWSVFSADYSQIELRVLAHMTHDEEMIAAFLSDEDIHAATAARVFGVSLADVTPDMRRKAKEVNFGLLYGMSEFGLAQRLRIDREEARSIITTYFTRFPGVRTYMETVREQVRRQGYVETLLGRRRAFPEINSPNHATRQAAERAAINHPIQGTAADIMKLAMIRVYWRLRESGLRARLLLQVHDELVFEVPDEEVAALQELVVGEMSSAYRLVVPLKVDVKVGRTWGG